MTALSMLLGSQGKNKFQLQQEILNVTGNNPENYVQHGGYGYRVWTKEGESIHEFCAAMNMTVGNTFRNIFTKSLKNSGGLLFGKEKQKKVFKRYKSLTQLSVVM